MNLTTIKFDPVKHYEAVSSWWTEHEFSVIPLTHLPSNGVIVCSDGHPIFAGFLYITDSQMAWIEFLVSNPRAGLKKKSKALDLTITELCSLAKSLRRTCVFTSSNNEALINRFTKHGFGIGDTNTTQLMRFA